MDYFTCHFTLHSFSSTKHSLRYVHLGRWNGLLQRSVLYEPIHLVVYFKSGNNERENKITLPKKKN